MALERDPSLKNEAKISLFGPGLVSNVKAMTLYFTEVLPKGQPLLGVKPKLKYQRTIERGPDPSCFFWLRVRQNLLSFPGMDRSLLTLSFGT